MTDDMEGTDAVESPDGQEPPRTEQNRRRIEGKGRNRPPILRKAIGLLRMKRPPKPTALLGRQEAAIDQAVMWNRRCNSTGQF
jgi:hypothetical protein